VIADGDGLSGIGYKYGKYLGHSEMKSEKVAPPT
jgi:hypothetical protein